MTNPAPTGWSPDPEVNEIPPGWYPDPVDPAGLRWFDGEAWTERLAPVPAAEVRVADAPAGAAAGPGQQSPTAQQRPAGQQLPARPPRARWSTGKRVGVIAGSVVGGFIVLIVLSVLAAIAIPLILNQRSKAAVAEFSALTCQDVAAHAVAQSARTIKAGQISLVGMTDAVLVEDGRAGLKVPPQGHEAFVMSCRGTGAWADGVTSVVTVQVNLTADRVEALSLIDEK